MPFRLSYANVVATLCLVALAGALAIGATAQSTSKRLAACYVKKGAKKGAMRYLGKASSRCKRSEKKVTWNQAGPAGPAGPIGPAGAAGVDGLSTTPGGMVAFFDLGACPGGWTEYATGRGRYLVGLNPGGTLAATVGSALGEQESRAVGTHAHGIDDPGHSHQIRANGSALRIPSTVLSTAGRAAPMNEIAPSTGPTVQGVVPAASGVTVQSAGGTAGTPAPYVQLLACQKD